MPHIDERIASLRSQLTKQNLDAWIINGTDPHQSEYVCKRYRTREWISSFTGSAGTVVITREAALLWVDSRYFIQAQQQIEGSEFVMMKVDTPSYPDPYTYLSDNLQEGAKVGIDSATLTVAAKASLEASFAGKLELVPCSDVLDAIWLDRPRIPSQKVVVVPNEIAGFSAVQKLAMLRLAMAQKGCDYTIVSSLDDIAWITNLRGSDVSYNPVFLSYLIVGRQQAWLFTNPDRFDAETLSQVKEDFEILAYEQVVPTLSTLVKKEDVIYFNPEKTNLLLFASFAHNKSVTGRDISTDLKASKNETELQGMRRAHLLDGVALVNFLAGLDTKAGKYTEIEISDLLKVQRQRNADCLGESFSPISGWAAHGAMCHYSADEKSNATVEGDGLLVLDTGGMYTFGLTDVTRTILFGNATDEQKRDYTLVLKGNLALAGMRFPEGTCGYQLDVLARQFLWQQGLSYFHGTGHGLGFRLCVHEGPQSISPKPLAVPLKKGMIVSDEPGIYKEGRHGIRIENILAIRDDVKTEFGQFLSFEVLTICPFERTLIDKKLLTEVEIAMVDAYHRWVYEELKDLVDSTALPYLERATERL
ncbi:aminopeptidase P family protein [Sphaerochaeta globosa]|uniref:Xaa-Pro aminopeptidase n=1 Tax=Sphaerochaeta globosa (strain ATCC BAA-1886 / DSM 22777 / Buddy) TaxID=158189 RepID=F0RX20_SPHGB|nr:aminopeptidase P family protein [Sphaerochaeta globosa]ADY11870.1 Xaa-Pro aminopeptidase [Sphaerochaeta globosa str. Buddy]